MAKTTALLRTQASRQQTIWGKEDEYVDYLYNNSFKTAADFNDYMAHYASRAENPQADPDKLLSYQKKVDSGRKGHISNEIQRASIEVAEGNQPDTYKLAVLENLYTQAYEEGLYDTAQNLRLQIDNQYIKMQNQAAAGYAQAAQTQTQTAQDFMKDLKNGDFGIVQTADGQVITMADVSNFIKYKGVNATMDALRGSSDLNGQPFDTTLKQIFGEGVDITGITPVQILAAYAQGAYEQAKELIMQIEDPYEREKQLSALNKQRATEKIDVAGASWTVDQLLDAASKDGTAGAVYKSVTQADGTTKLVGAPVAERIWQYDQDGNSVQLVEVRGFEDERAVTLGYGAGESVVYGLQANGDIRQLTKEESEKIGTTAKTVGGNIGKAAAATLLASIPGVGVAIGAAAAVKSMLGGNKDTAVQQAIDPLKAVGLVKSEGNTYAISNELKAELEKYGVIAPEYISQDGIIESGGKLQMKLQDREGNMRLFDIEGAKTFGKEGIATIAENRAITGSQYLQEANANTTSLLRSSDLMAQQQALTGGTLLPGAGMQGMSGTTGVLQQAASQQQINNMRAENLRVQNEQANRTVTVAPPTNTQVNLAVTPAPQRTVSVQPSQPTKATVSVQPTTPAKITVSGAPAYQQPPKQNTSVVQKAANWFKGLF